MTFRMRFTDTDMRSSVRGHVGGLATLLSVVSLVIVFGTVGGLVPSSLLPRAPGTLITAIPHLNAALSALALVAIVAGVRAIHRQDIQTHRRRMGAAFALFVAFLALYLYRLTLEGTTHFAGPAAIEPVYLLVLAIHVSLAILCLPLLYYVLLLAYAYDTDELSSTPHPRVGRVAALLWAISFALGIVVYLLLYIVFPG
jgi:putative membrane protein